jgi:hypothetical protein
MFSGKVQKANQLGSKKVTIPKDLTGPNGDEIEIGDRITLDVVDVEKRDHSDE